MPNARKPKLKQRDRILSVLSIEPRSVTMLEARTRIDRRRVNKIIAELRATSMAYVYKYEIVGGAYTPFYAAGDKLDALMPMSLISRKEKFEEALNTRVKPEKKPCVKERPAPFDPSKPVACYGIWGLA